MRSRKPADAFGLSLLDVLSNSLGGTILLMLIVASSLGGKDKTKQNRVAIEVKGLVASSHPGSSLETDVDAEFVIQIWIEDSYNGTLVVAENKHHTIPILYENKPNPQGDGQIGILITEDVGQNPDIRIKANFSMPSDNGYLVTWFVKRGKNPIDIDSARFTGNGFILGPIRSGSNVVNKYKLSELN